MSDSLAPQLQSLLEIDADYEKMRELVIKWKAQQHSQIEIYLVFRHFMILESASQDETKYDALLEVMDEIWGHCPLQRALFPGQSLTVGQVEERRKPTPEELI